MSFDAEGRDQFVKGLRALVVRARTAVAPEGYPDFREILVEVERNDVPVMEEHGVVLHRHRHGMLLLAQ